MHQAEQSRSRLRALLARTRLHTVRTARFGGTFLRFLEYGWSLVVWSRIARGRRQLRRLELPLSVLEGKGLTSPAPRLKVEGASWGPVFDEGFAEVYALLYANLQPASLLVDRRHAQPGPAFRGVYLWDSAFVAQVWKAWDASVAREVLEAVVELRQGDRLQHVVSEFRQSDFTQPPLIAWSAWKLARELEENDRREFLKGIFPPLVAFNRWLYAHRQVRGGLFAWAHPYESGVENSPRFSNTDESRLRDTRRMGAPDFCAYVVLQNEALARIAAFLGETAEAARFQAQAEDLRAAMNRFLWNEGAGLYFDREVDTGEWIEARTIASLLPLWAGVPSAAQAARLRAWILRPDGFGSAMPLPSVACGEPSFEKDMWRGPVWLNTAYGVLRGMLRYGYDAEAGELACRLCEGVYQVFHDERYIYEFYDPEVFHTRELRRKRGNWWKAFTLGTGPQKDFVGWTGLVNTLCLEVLLGLERIPGGWSVRPRFPARLAGTRWAFELPGEGLRLEVSVTPAGGIAGTVSLHGTTRSLAVAPGAVGRFAA
jgi:hypothetical protein